MLGPPGAGKGTQAIRLSQHLGIPQVSTGDILRRVRTEDSPLGREIQEIMRRGELVPDQLVNDIVAVRLGQNDCHHGFILDGFPRTVRQAGALSELLLGFHKNLDRVVSLDVEENELVSRLSGRRVCPHCNRVYHLRFNPPQRDALCDVCPQTALVIRDDDREETVRERLSVYRADTAPLIAYYEKQDLLTSVDGALSPDRVFQAILTALPSRAL